MTVLVWSGKLKTKPPIKVIKLKDLFLFKVILCCLHALFFFFFPPCCAIDVLPLWLISKTINEKNHPSKPWEWCSSPGRVQIGFSVLEASGFGDYLGLNIRRQQCSLYGSTTLHPWVTTVCCSISPEPASSLCADYSLWKASQISFLGKPRRCEL